MEAFARGGPVVIYDADDREGEADLIYPAGAVTPSDVARLRNDAGGLICVAFPEDVCEALDLPFLHEAIDHPTTRGDDLGYDARPSFSLPVNHRDAYTGVTDRDRALTITQLAEAAVATGGGEYGPEEFAAEFRCPGHVSLLRGASSLADRQGHTELGLALADAAGREPAVVVSEMLDDATGDARSKAEARAYARRHRLAYAEGADLLAAFG